MAHWQIELNGRDDEGKLCGIYPMVILCLFLINLASTLTNWISIPVGRISTLLQGCIALRIVYCMPALIRRLNRPMVFSVLISIAVCLGNMCLFPHLNRFFKETVVTHITICLSVFVVIQAVNDFKRLYHKLRIVAYIISVFSAFLLLLVLSGKMDGYMDESYSMGLGYALVLPLILLISDAVVKKSILSGIATLVVFFTLFSFGSRGPLLGVAIFLIFYILNYLIKGKCYLTVILLTVFLGIFFLTYRDMLRILAQVMEQLGINSRTVTLLLEEEVYLSQRDVLYQQLINQIKIDPFAFRGINSEWLVIGVYAHNLVLELIYQFGCLWGGLLCLLIFSQAIRSIWIINKGTIGKLVFIFMCVSIPQLMVSSSLWTNHGFWMWLALVVRFGTSDRPSICVA